MRVDFVDVWQWAPDPVVGYTVSGAYNSLTVTERAFTPASILVTLLWRKDVPLKVSVFAWRLLHRLKMLIDNFTET